MSDGTLIAEARQTQVVQAHFDAISRDWAARYECPPRRMSDSDLQLRRETARRWLQECLAAAPQPQNVLDVGCGPGQTLDGFSRRQLHVHGIDVSPGMIAVASRRHPEDEYHVGDAATLPFAKASMDVVLCLGVLEYVPDPGTVLEAVHGVLRPGGRLIVSFPNRRSALRRLSRVATAVERRLARLLRGGKEAQHFSTRPKYEHRHWSPSEAVQLLSRAGLIVERLRFQTFGLWGWLGRGALPVALSAWLTRVLGDRPTVARWLACTLIVQARRPRSDS